MASSTRYVPPPDGSWATEICLPVVTGVAVISIHVVRLLFSYGTVGDVDL
jgi:hypothetical protein